MNNSNVYLVNTFISYDDNNITPINPNDINLPIQTTGDIWNLIYKDSDQKV